MKLKREKTDMGIVYRGFKLDNRDIGLWVKKEKNTYVANPGVGIDPIQYTVNLRVKGKTERQAINKLSTILKNEYKRVTHLLK